MSTERDLVYRISVRGQAEGINHLASFLKQAQKLADQAAKAEVAIHSSTVNAAKAAAAQKVAVARGEAKASADASKARVKNEIAAYKTIERQQNDHFKAIQKFQASITKLEAQELAKREKQQADHDAKIARQQTRDLERRARDLAFDRKRFYRGVATAGVDGMAGAISSGYNVISRGAREIASGMGINRAFDVSDIVSQRLQISKLTRAASIEARVAGGRFDFDEAGAAKKFAQVAKRTGFTQAELAQAVDKYSELGSAATGIGTLDRIADNAQAMGTSPETIAKVRGVLGVVSKSRTGKEMDEFDKDKVLAYMHFGGKTGVFRAEELAAQSEAIFSRASVSGYDLVSGARQFINFANEARKSTGNGSSAKTAIGAIQDQLVKHADKIKGNEGVNVFDKDGGERNFIDVIQELIVKTHGDQTKLSKYIDTRSSKAMATLLSRYQASEQRAKGSGAQGMKDLLMGDESLGMNANQLVAEMQKDAGHANSSDAVNIAKSTETARQRIEEALPSLATLAEKFAQAIDMVGKVADMVKDHPVLAGGAAIGGAAALSVGRFAAKGLAASAARWVGDRMVQTVPGLMGKGAGAALGALGGAIGQAGAQPVYVTGAAPGVMGGGGGIGGALGGVGGAVGAGALGMGAAVALMAGVTALGVNYAMDHPNGNLRTASQGEMQDLVDLNKKKADDQAGMQSMLDEFVKPSASFVNLDAGASRINSMGEDAVNAAKQADWQGLNDSATRINAMGEAAAGQVGMKLSVDTTTDGVKRLSAALATAATNVEAFNRNLGGTNANRSAIQNPPAR